MNINKINDILIGKYDVNKFLIECIDKSGYSYRKISRLANEKGYKLSHQALSKMVEKHYKAKTEHDRYKINVYAVFAIIDVLDITFLEAFEGIFKKCISDDDFKNSVNLRQILKYDYKKYVNKDNITIFVNDSYNKLNKQEKKLVKQKISENFVKYYIISKHGMSAYVFFNYIFLLNCKVEN